MSVLMPEGRQSYEDSAGQPLVGGRLYTYQAGTNTPLATYQDPDNVSPNTNPIVLDGRGECVVFWQGNYKVVLTDANGVVIWTQDKLASSPADDLREDLANRTDPNLGAGMVGFGVLDYPDGTVGGALYTTIWGDGGVVDQSVIVLAANALGQPIRFVGVTRIAAPVTITVPIMDTMAQIFTTASQVTIDNGLPVRPEWFGPAAGNIRLAVNALPATGGTVRLGNRRYPPSYTSLTPLKVSNGSGVAGVDYLSKPNVRIEGAGMPRVATLLNRLEDGSGTIIEGPFFIYANGVQVTDLGVDSGSDVCAAYYGGVAQEGLAHLQINKAAPGFAFGQHFDRVRGLCKDSASAVHAALFEAMDSWTIGEAFGVHGIHGVVIKSQNGQAKLLNGFKCDVNPVILKSEDYAPCSNVTVDTIVGSTSLDAAVRIQAATVNMAGIKVGKVLAISAPIGLTFDGAWITSDATVDSVSTYTCPKGIRRVNQTRGVKITEAINNSCTTVGFEDVSGIANYPFSFRSLENLGCQAGVSTNGLLIVDQYLSTSTVGYDVTYTSTTSRVLFGTTRRLAPGQASITNANPVLINGWSNIGGGQSTFDVQLENYGVRIKGLVAFTTASNIMFQLPPQMRPGQHIQFSITGWTSGTTTSVAVQLSVPTTGNVTIISPPAAVNSWYNLEGVLLPGTYI